MSTIEAQQTIPAGTYAADPAHSSLEFTAQHMDISTIRGSFLKFEASLEGGDQPRVSGTIETATIDTRDETRDGHLKNADFFDVERFPTASFSGTLVAPDRLVGELTLRGVTKPVEMTANVTGPAVDPWGNSRVGIDLEGTVNRHDFGVSWNLDLPNGGKLLEDEVTLIASLSFVKQA
jgi:polyisoprenoid-binding protein YceI